MLPQSRNGRGFVLKKGLTSVTSVLLPPNNWNSLPENISVSFRTSHITFVKLIQINHEPHQPHERCRRLEWFNLFAGPPFQPGWACLRVLASVSSLQASLSNESEAAHI